MKSYTNNCSFIIKKYETDKLKNNFLMVNLYNESLFKNFKNKILNKDESMYIKAKYENSYGLSIFKLYKQSFWSYFTTFKEKFWNYLSTLVSNS